MLRHALVLLAYTLLAAACTGSDPSSRADAVGTLVLALDDTDAGSPYVLEFARLTLAGPEQHELSLGTEPTPPLALTPGVYTATVDDDYRVVARDAPGAPVAATLVGENPTSLLVTAGSTSALRLHFAVSAPPNPALDEASLAVSSDVDADEPESSCARHLVISELDYEQPGADEREFVEVAVARACRASLSGVVLELVNGSDGSVYGRYALDQAAAALAPDQPLVVGDPALLATLPPGTPQLALNGAGLQNGPDALRLVRAGELLDSVAYEDRVAGEGHGAAAPVDDGTDGLTRCGATGDDAHDFALHAPTPGALAPCAGPAAGDAGALP